MNSEIIADPDNIFKYLQTSKFLNESGLTNMIDGFISSNPYQSKKSQIDQDKSTMWKEQCVINFPILYLASIYLYIYAKHKNCNTFLFATRDCCHWYKIFIAYFHIVIYIIFIVRGICLIKLHIKVIHHTIITLNL